MEALDGNPEARLELAHLLKGVSAGMEFRDGVMFITPARSAWTDLFTDDDGKPVVPPADTARRLRVDCLQGTRTHRRRVADHH
jgi:hypothetical protein